MGPAELMPELPHYGWTQVPEANVTFSRRIQECNYLQAIEGGIDSSHVSFLHGAALKSDPLFVGSKGNLYNEHDRMPEFDVVDFPGGLLIGARRNAEGGRYYWRITPWIMPLHTIIPPRAGHPLGAHVWVPIDDENCWAWSINYHPNRALSSKEIDAMKSGRGIHVSYVPGTYVPLQNKRNDYLIDREKQKQNLSFSGVEGIAMQDASLQESMGAVQDRTRENLCPTDRGIVMTRRKLLQAAQASREGKAPPGLRAEEQRVRSCAIELPRDQHFKDHAKHGLFAPPNTDPVTV
jgi:hypothetical protein